MCAPLSKVDGTRPLTRETQVTAAAEAIAILAADLGDPLLGIGALRSVLEEILKAYDPKDGETARAYSLALKCLGHNLARLPAAVLEDEVVRVRDFIMRVRLLRETTRFLARR